jgi:hypothetical protein
MTKKKNNFPNLKNIKLPKNGGKKPQKPNNKYTPFFVLFAISILLAAMLPYLGS